MAALEKLTRLHDKTQMENFLTYGKWDLTDADIEKLNKDEERKERVGLNIFFRKKVKICYKLGKNGKISIKLYESLLSVERYRTEKSSVRLRIQYRFLCNYSNSCFFQISIFSILQTGSV